MGDAQHRLQLCGRALRDAASPLRRGPSRPYLSTGNGQRAGVEALRVLYDSWIDCAEEAYARIAHSDSFINGLAISMNARSTWRNGIPGERRTLGPKR